ncbi:MAG TPA: hypothetical protein VFC67_20900 [Prolixibacteraceae bacterium]|nr:hypothetical protein [Prolixibacteraceae bacterium]
MRKLVLSLIFLVGLFAYSCTAPPDTVKRIDQPTEYAQVISVDQVMQADFTFVANPVVLPSPDTPVLTNWMTETSKAVTISANSKSAHKMYSSNYISNVNKHYLLSTFYIPDKSSRDGNFSNRDKLTQMGFTPYTI